MGQGYLDAYGSIEVAIPIREEYKHLYVDLRTLKTDGNNPNRMSETQKKALWSWMQEVGWLYPIIANKEGVIGDGEQRLEVCLDHKEFYGPVLKLDVPEVTRRLMRQVLNKLKGTHLKDLDALEYYRIAQEGREKDLVKLAILSEAELKAALRTVRDDEKKAAQKFRGQAHDEQETKDVKCPNCGLVFNPDQHPVEIPLQTDTVDVQFKDTPPIGEKEHKIVFDGSFSTVAPSVTPKILAVSESFGIGVDESIEHQVLKKVDLSYSDGDVLYVTGDSGGGKSTLLRLFEKHELDRGRIVRVLSTGEESDTSLIDGLPGDAESAMGLLNIAGLGEAALMIKRFSELSDGQKYRYRIAQLLAEKADTVLIDNFGDSLDRETAKVLAYNLQKCARRRRVTLMLATPHHDLLEDVNPDTVIYKGFGKETNIEYRRPLMQPLSLIKEITIEPGGTADVEALEGYHYLGSGRLITRFIYRMVYRGRTIGVILYISPQHQLAIRNSVMPEYRATLANTEILTRVNQEIVRIARVIIHPKYRGTGLATLLIKDTMQKTGYLIVETIAAMARFNPVFEKAGMKMVGIMQPTKAQKKLEETIRRLGGDPALMRSPTKRTVFVDGLNGDQLGDLEDSINFELDDMEGKGKTGFNRSQKIKEQIGRDGIASVLGELLGAPRVYLYWRSDGKYPEKA